MERNAQSHSEGEASEKPCRTCTDFKTWFKQRKQSLGTKGAPGPVSTDISPEVEYDPVHNKCPLDRDTLGRSTWGFLHTMAAYYPDKPNQQQQLDMRQFINTFSKFYPCDDCAEDFRNRIRRHPPDVSTRVYLSRWFCDAHNHVNRRTGKEEFDCSLVDERWRDGWADGSCG